MLRERQECSCACTTFIKIIDLPSIWCTVIYAHTYIRPVHNSSKKNYGNTDVHTYINTWSSHSLAHVNAHVVWLGQYHEFRYVHECFSWLHSEYTFCHHGECYLEIIHIWDTMHGKWMSSKYSFCLYRNVLHISCRTYYGNCMFVVRLLCSFRKWLSFAAYAQTHSVKSLTGYGYWSVESWEIAETIFHIYITITMHGDEWIRCRVLNTSVACCGMNATIFDYMLVWVFVV